MQTKLENVEGFDACPMCGKAPVVIKEASKVKAHCESKDHFLTTYLFNNLDELRPIWNRRTAPLV